MLLTFPARLCAFACLALSLTACDRNATPDVTDVASNIRPTGMDGNVVWDQLFEEQVEQHVTSEGVGYAFKSGVDANGTAVAFVGLINEDDIAPPTRGGTAVYKGRSRAVSVSQPGLIATLATLGLANGTFQRGVHSAAVTIQADLDNGTFMGENGNATAGTFTHRFSGSLRNGRVTGRGFANVGTTFSVDTRLDGRIGNDEGTLVFKSVGERRVSIAGGMNVTRR